MGLCVTVQKAYSSAYCHLMDRLLHARYAQWVFYQFYDLVFVRNCCAHYFWFIAQLLHICIKQIIDIFIAAANAINDLNPFISHFERN